MKNSMDTLDTTTQRFEQPLILDDLRLGDKITDASGSLKLTIVEIVKDQKPRGVVTESPDGVRYFVAEKQFGDFKFS